MRIEILIVDNHPEDEQVKNFSDWLTAENPECTCEVLNTSTFRSKDILSHNPDFVMVDVGLTDDDERYLVGIEGGNKHDPSRELSGISYCRRLKASFPQIPAVLLSQYFVPETVTAALAVGADGFISKPSARQQTLFPAVRAAFYRGKTDDVALYEALRELLEDEKRNPWQAELMTEALEAFFVRGSAARRLTGLWCSLAETIEPLMSSEIVNSLLSALMDSEALMHAANPRMRDHVCHSGNVFWLGYYLLNTLSCFSDPTSLEGYAPEWHEGSAHPPFEHLNLAWVIASLLHDVGYLRGQLGKIEERIARGQDLFDDFHHQSAAPTPDGAPGNLGVLRRYLDGLGPDGTRLFRAIETTTSGWGRDAPRGDLIVEDHGVSSAAAFLRRLAASNIDIEKSEPSQILLHAASAIALHNLPKWNLYWEEADGPVRLPFGLLPIAALLTLCDELQGWGREPSSDPFDISLAKDMRDARIQYRGGYHRGSRIVSFHVLDDPVPKIDLGIQYLMAHGHDVDQIAKDIRSGIIGWVRDRVPMLRWTLGLDGFLESTITHWVPATTKESVEVKLYSDTDPL